MSLSPLTHNQLTTYRRNPYAYSSIHIEEVFYNTPEKETRLEKLFRRSVTTFYEMQLNNDSEVAKTTLLKRISGYHSAPILIPFALKIFNSVPRSSDPEFYSTLLYIIKKEKRKDLFPLAHDVFQKAIRNNAISEWSIMHYLTIGIHSSEFQFLYPIVNALLIKFPSEKSLLMARNYFIAAERFLPCSQKVPLQRLIAQNTATDFL